ncbi:MAG: M20/M25/M40 family metallo-hydrolase [Anaerolineae bacterium]|nr:M20/M25/M40 family metallo-hydrolase [Anaerolineae bacterium]
MEAIAPLRSHLEARLPHYLDLLRQMVAINSFTTNAAGVNELGRLTAEAFAFLGFQAEFVTSTNPAYGQHLVLTRAGRTPYKIGLVSHLDTVFPAAEEEANDFRWREEGQRIYGPGTVDIKGGTVIMYMVLDALRAAAPTLFADVNWVLLLDASEEADGADFGALCRQRLAGETTLACLIFEGGLVENSGAKVVVARKGMAVYEVRAEGRAAHAGTSHEQGANAIVQLAEAVQKIAGFTDYERHLTFNVGTFSGGSVTNRVPHEAIARVEMRAYAAGVYEDGIAKMMALPQEASVSSPNGNFQCRLDVEIIRKTKPWPRNVATDRLLQIWQEAGSLVGLKVLPEERGGLSDGNYFWDAIPTLDGLGASGGNAHCSERSEDGLKDQEYVQPGSLVPKALLNSVALLRLWQEGTG